MQHFEIVTTNNHQEEHDVEELITVKEHKKQLKRTAVMAFMAALILMVGFGFGIKAPGLFTDSDRMAAKFVTQHVNLESSDLPSGLESDNNSITGIVEKRGPAVVTIETESQQNISRNNLYGRLFGSANPRQQTVQGMGSGFLISKDGYLLTNNHVIEGADTIKVRLLGSEESNNARVIGVDEQLDLAVLKIDAKQELPVIPLGNSDSIKTGDWAIAIGNPYGLDHTVTIGVISAKERPLTVGDTHFESLLQTDASINPGNSGGPLLNLKGEVIGINTAINAEGQGLGFAIPINMVQEVLEDLLTKGKVSRPWLGVSLLDMTPELAGYLKVDDTQGVVIASVVSGSPAYEAGLQQGDVIMSINGQKITESEQISQLISNSKIGDKILIEIIRNKAIQTMTVKLAEK